MRAHVGQRMPAHDSRSEYASRMHRVLETIDRQPDQPLKLEIADCDPQTGAFACVICIPVVAL
jgi:hypothetical protein